MNNDDNKIGGHAYAGILNQKKALLAKRWDNITARARQRNWNDISIRKLASQSGLEWYRARGDELLLKFLGCDGSALMASYSLGLEKVSRLCEIVERALDAPPGADLSDHPSAVAAFDPHQTLVAWGISPAYPCQLTRLPVRLANFCGKRGLAGIGELLDEWERLGFEGFKAQPNLGSKSVREMERFVQSLRLQNFETASLFLPVAPSCHGLSLGSALKLIAADPSALERSLLERRLVQGMTLEASAEESGLTRERVRQVESKFLREVSDVFEYFSADYSRLLDSWLGIRAWPQQLELLELGRDADLIAAALESVFKDTPQAVARNLGEEFRLENWQEELLAQPELWFGGVKVSVFLTEHIPAAEQEEFCEYIAGSSAVRLDFIEGRVHPARTGLRHTVEALVAMEDDPIPLTWLMALLARTGYHTSLTPRELLRRRPGWIKDYGFPADMILWDE